MVQIPQEILDQAKELRAQLHAAPELSGQERETEGLLKDFLKKRTTLELVEEDGWFYGVHREGDQLPNVALRADMDAISGENGPYHGCGHDGHSAILAGAALACEGKTLGKNLFFLFQSAEETGKGAMQCREMLKKEKIQAIYGLHNLPGFPLGTVMIRAGTFACASVGITLLFQGAQSHAAYPENGRNPAFAICRLVGELSSILSPENYQGLVLATVVHLLVGEKAFGVSAGEGELSLTLRAHRSEDLALLKEKICQQAEALAQADGLTLTISYQDEFPDTTNPPQLCQRFEAALKKSGISVSQLQEPMRWSEDFGWYLKETEGLFFGWGAGEDCPGLHTPEYEFRDELLAKGIQSLLTAVFL